MLKILAKLVLILVASTGLAASIPQIPANHCAAMIRHAEREQARAEALQQLLHESADQDPLRTVAAIAEIHHEYLVAGLSEKEAALARQLMGNYEINRRTSRKDDRKAEREQLASDPLGTIIAQRREMDELSRGPRQMSLSREIYDNALARRLEVIAEMSHHLYHDNKPWISSPVFDVFLIPWPTTSRDEKRVHSITAQRQWDLINMVPRSHLERVMADLRSKRQWYMERAAGKPDLLLELDLLFKGLERDLRSATTMTREEFTELKRREPASTPAHVLDGAKFVVQAGIVYMVYCELNPEKCSQKSAAQ